MGVLNFLVFIVIDMILGGDALNGKTVAGHYFLGNHGVYTEVNYSVYMYSSFHAASLFITHPLAMLCGFVANRKGKTQ